MFAQTEGRDGPIQVPPTEDCGSVDVWIDRIIWNAEGDRLQVEADAEKGYFIDNHNIICNSSITIPNQTSYHIAVLRFKGNENFKTDDTFSFDASVRLPANFDKQVYFLFANHPTGSINTELIDDNTVRFKISGESNVLKAGGGVITTVGIMGRSMYSSGTPCMRFKGRNRVENETCTLPDITSTICSPISPATKVEADKFPSIHSYPNPTQDY